MLEVGEETVPATVLFSEGSVGLVVGEDEVGAWPTSDVEFVSEGNGYDMRAEGDSIRFLPDERSDFGGFLRSPSESAPSQPAAAESTPSEPPSETPNQPTNGGTSAAPSEEPALAPLGEPRRLPPSPSEEEPSGFLAATGDNGERTEEDQEPGIEVEPPDEYYAAGLSGPRAGTPGSGATSQFVPPPPRTEPPPDQDDPQVASGEPAEGQLATPIAPPIVDPPPQNGEAPAFESRVVEMEAPDFHSSSPATPPSVEADPVKPGQDPEELTPDAAESDAETETPLTRLLKRARAASQRVAATEPLREVDEDTGDDLPRPISDSQNLRQWALVVAGGVVVLALIGVVAWGLISFLGGEDPAELASEPVATTVSAPAPTNPAPTPTTAPPLTTIPPENVAAAGQFVAAWNDIARDYAYHFSINADNLPISTALAPTVHLTYGEDGVLLLTMAPEGTGADRDILVAMGVAVAWADPSLSPEGRKELLGALGIDVDDPQVGKMGGQLARNGVNYSTTVSDTIIRFEVVPAA